MLVDQNVEEYKRQLLASTYTRSFLRTCHRIAFEVEASRETNWYTP
jgi:hypothetical protein